MFGLLNYNVTAAAAGATNTDLTAATDPDFSVRNGHYLFTNSFRLLAAAPVGVSVTRGRFQVPSWNAIGEYSIFNANRSLQPPSNPQADLYVAYPIPIPQMEEFQVQLSNNLGAATEIENCPILIATDDWNQNLPRGRPIIARASFTATPTLNAWSGGQNLTLASNLRGGVYAVVGATVQGTNAVAFRMIFPRMKMYAGRKLRPGWLTQNALGDTLSNQLDPWVLALGEWGRFHTTELPQVEVFGTLAGAITYQVFLWLVFLGESLSILDQWSAGGS